MEGYGKYISLVIFILVFSNLEKLNFKQCSKCDNTKINIINLKTLLPSKHIMNNILKDQSHFTKLNEGFKMNFHQIKEHFPEIIDKYLNNKLLKKLKKQLNEKELFFADEKYRIMLRVYKNSKDGVEWHYDNNFTSGKRYTLVIPIYEDVCSKSNLMIRDRKTGKTKTIKVNIGDGIIFDEHTFHKVTAQKQNCKRITIVIPLYTDKNISLFGKIEQNFRNVIFNIFKL